MQRFRSLPLINKIFVFAMVLSLTVPILACAYTIALVTGRQEIFHTVGFVENIMDTEVPDSATNVHYDLFNWRSGWVYLRFDIAPDAISDFYDSVCAESPATLHPYYNPFDPANVFGERETKWVGDWWRPAADEIEVFSGTTCSKDAGRTYPTNFTLLVDETDPDIHTVYLYGSFD